MKHIQKYGYTLTQWSKNTMRIIEMRGDTPEIVSATVKRCVDKGYSVTFLDRLTILVDDGEVSTCLWLGRPDGHTKTVALNKLDKEMGYE